MKPIRYLFIVLFVVGLFLILVSENLIPLSLVPLQSIMPSTSSGSTASAFSSSAIQHPAFLSIFNLISGNEYNWTVTATNNGNSAWTDEWITLRIVNASAGGSYTTLSDSSPNFAGVFGLTSGGTGAIQTCNGNINSTACLVPLSTSTNGNAWVVSALGNGVSVQQSSSSYVITILLPSGIQPGQSETVSFGLKIPGLSSSSFGNYYAIQNLVVQSPAISGSDLVNYNVQEFSVGSGINGAISTDGISLIAGSALAVASIVGLAFTRRF